MKRLALAVALAFGAGAAGAATPEPLLVTALPDPHLVLVSGQADQITEQSLDRASARFGLAIAKALESDQRAVEEACKSRPPADPRSSARLRWEARCRYQRW